MSSSISQRPGVYSSLVSSGIQSSSGGGRVVGLAAVSTVATPGLHTVTTASGAAALFASTGEVGKTLCEIAINNGASSVVCSLCASASDMATAIGRFATEEKSYVLICDSDSLTVHQAMVQTVASAAAQRREKIAVLGMTGAAKAQLLARATALNSERAVLAGTSGSGINAAAAMAGVIAAQTDPAAPMIELELSGVTVTGAYSDADFDSLILGGVTPVEAIGGKALMSRAVTTKTTTDGVADASFRELNTILIADDVIPGLRSTLKSEFYRAKNTAKTREAIRTRVILELEDRIEKEIIESYDDVTVEADDDDPTLCLVAFSFAVAHGLNRVQLTAVISV